ncbi:sensor protein DegS [Clostridium aceticum]|uniref:Oxygen sensor histidine kinase NreB n=1 Tax=Clostridium aceticum TaxID=84022 RepID=A0A0D8IF66_9CLOT|nr:sensor histidine kinase [Clostridium aceticum]AKL94909.1 sensor protein DegS [Clostridium aceticum]KJF27831.1 histidine kinase [Clostridium aceticum]
MNNHILGITKMNEIFTKILMSIEESKSEIFDVAENIRRECSEFEKQLVDIQENIRQLIKEVDELQGLEKQSRRELLKVSKNFKEHREEDIRQAYEKANTLQIQLIIKRQQESEFIKKRTEIEIRLKNTKKTLEKAEGLTSKIGVVQDFLQGNLQDINNTLEDIKQKHVLGRKIIHTQEEERRRVARDIHDGPAQSLANLVIKAEVCEKLLEVDVERSKEELQDLKKCIRESIKDIRKIIYNLQPMSIDDVGFIPTIQRYIEKYQSETNIVVEFIILSDFSLDDSTKSLCLFRIVQEALNNVRKHAKATNIKIYIEMKQEEIFLNILDNGIGFDTEQIKLRQEEESGFGLLSIQERVGLLSGNVDIKSELNKGTKISITIPI